MLPKREQLFFLREGMSKIIYNNQETLVEHT